MYQYYIKFYVNVKKLIVSCFLQNCGLLPEPRSGQNAYSYHFMGGSARPCWNISLNGLKKELFLAESL